MAKNRLSKFSSTRCKESPGVSIGQVKNLRYRATLIENHQSDDSPIAMNFSVNPVLGAHGHGVINTSGLYLGLLLNPDRVNIIYTTRRHLYQQQSRVDEAPFIAKVSIRVLSLPSEMFLIPRSRFNFHE